MKTQVKRNQAHRTQKQWHKLVNEFDPSLQTLNEYCKKNKIGPSSFYQWKAKLSLPKTTNKEETPTFVPLPTLPTSTAQQAPEWDLELELGHGIVLRLSQS